ncbi:hypothetical protein COV93_03915 [Candidatus Woesearchaeota archaeon CG11_big_fil_rev_8_21_14_0_20_43_8]|uniref:Polymerase nucleotidyl transferase domain-containing protein n=1 Tax=Candidatus Roizmanbacteria bacterium CG22_combo_CG10-13_8_21_14_all_35_9 TaxID=1974861 RepID=A0A2H0BXU8_9BACT|nr:MAG: hypothetical protein COV93_03915 [Candidatus Woesearchaeota archaeon CG11_big_fil_rev_8_21_14_0_20_43_8]PIO06954.1 MAG: hypothetical protein COT47_02095 [Candidatus Woesearchaeota archaeon CG08_land_8_20_14_0_20_43_7]PIP62431.1 MAG: hypothetical protein COW98_04110 [Candidatus Roizmanbacteria bacterium CG22_combo_CG10-13_8_21_14_all_35_9]
MADDKIIKEFVKTYLKKDSPEVILLTGSRTFGINDSDVDLCVVNRDPKKYLRKYPSGFTAVEKYPKYFKGLEFEVEVVTWQHLNKYLKSFTTFHPFHYSNVKILLDKNGRYKKNIKKMPIKIRKAFIFDFFEDAYDDLNNAKKANWRKYGATEKIHLHKALDTSLNLLYLMNDQFIPAIKWKIFLLKTLKTIHKKFNEKYFTKLDIKKIEFIFGYLRVNLLKKNLITKKELAVIFDQ